LPWLKDRATICRLETRHESWRCNQAICDWADDLFPAMPATKSSNDTRTGHDGVHKISSADVHAYVTAYDPVILRDSVKTSTMGLPAMNIGVAKGSTFDRVLIFPTGTMLAYIRSGDLAAFRSAERLYVAVTRARHSVAFVVPDDMVDYRMKPLI
jgi:DNA helicase II / ATP-dependent DNA helicase PcrA